MMKITRQQQIRQALEDIELLRLCNSIIDKEDLYPIKSEIEEVFELAQKKKGYVSNFYRIQAEYNGVSEEDL